MKTKGAVIGHSRSFFIDSVIYVEPQTYGALNQAKRYEVARAIGEIVHSEELQRLILGMHESSATDRTRVGLSLSGDLGPVFAAFMVEDTDPKEGDGGSTPWAVTAQWMGIGLQYGDRDGVVDETFWTLGYQYRLSGNTRIQLSYENNDWTDDDKFVARYRVDF